MATSATPSATFTRPNDANAYASGDLVANNVTNTSVVPMSWVVSGASIHGNLFVRRARIEKSTTSVTNSSFRVHLYETSPTVTNGDNGVWTSTYSSYLGSLDVVVDKAFSDGAAGTGGLTSSTGNEIVIDGTVDKTIYGLLEARGAYTPGAQEVFVVILEIMTGNSSF